MPAETAPFFSEIRAARLFSGPPVASAADVLRELDRRRREPEFRDEADVYAQCAPPVHERLAARPAMSRRLAGRNVSLRCVTVSPGATLTVHPRGGNTVLTCGPCSEPTDLTLEMPAATAKLLFGGRLDIVRALRRHEVTSNASLTETLRSFSVLKDLFAESAAGTG